MRLIGLCLFAVGLGMPISAGAQAADAQAADRQPTVAELLAHVENMHPSGYFLLAEQLLEDQPNEAGKWLYVAQLRYRLHLAASPDLDPSGDPALFASLFDVVGRAVNERVAADFDAWLGAMDAALEWDAAHPNGFTSTTQHAALWHEQRGHLTKLRREAAARREELIENRRRNGLPVR